MTAQTAEQRERDDARVPTYVDKARLCFELSISESHVEKLVKLGQLPAPKRLGVKLVWEWAEVKRRVDGDEVPVAPSETDDVRRVTAATKQACNNS